MASRPESQPNRAQVLLQLVLCGSGRVPTNLFALALQNVAGLLIIAALAYCVDRWSRRERRVAAVSA